MDSLSTEQITSLVKRYQDHRDSFPGATLTSPELRQVVEDVSAVASQEGDEVAKVIAAARIWRAGQPNPLAPAQGRKQP